MHLKYPWRRCAGLVGAVMTVLTGRTEGASAEYLVHEGMCDASAAISLGDHRFVVANDEDSVLRIYESGTGGPTVGQLDLGGFLKVDAEHPETDIEGAAQVGRRIYWITSHGRNKDGKMRESRHRFFATSLTATGEGLAPDGVPYGNLLSDMMRDSRLAGYGLGAASQLPPKEPGALNIEGLCARPDGTLWIGFRNPIPQGRALLVPLLNPEEVVQGRMARFGDPLLLDLAGRGVRDLVWTGKEFWIVAGSNDGKGKSRLYRWGGDQAAPRRFRETSFEDFNPEAIVAYPSRAGELQVLSDDGTLLIGGVKCKETLDPRLRRFRSVWVKVGGE